jgi:phosphate starvation-inducible PhoH-like protein
LKKRVEQHSYRKGVQARNERQKELLIAIKEKDLVFATGAAGVGKTYITCCKAIEDFQNNKIGKIILVRPAITSEDIGYLPGTEREKINPYMLPMYDIFCEKLSQKVVENMIDNGQIELASLGFMRGRSLHNSFVILDEAQNTTRTQMLMFLTRIGENSKCVVTGDPDQSDLDRKDNGLIWACQKLSQCPDIKIINFCKHDVVRSTLVSTLLHYLGDD